MLLATLAILDAAASRWPVSFVQASKWGYYVAIDAIILAVVAFDTITRRQLAHAYAWGVPLVIASHVLRELIGRTSLWKSLSRMIVG